MFDKRFQIFRKLKRLVLFCAFFSFTTFAIGQKEATILDTSYGNLTWEQLLEKLETDFDLSFFYDEKILANIKMDAIENNVALEEYLMRNFSSKGIKLSFDTFNNVFLHENKKIETSVSTDIYQKIKSNSNTANTSPTAENNQFLNTTQEYVAKVLVIGSRKKGLDQKKVTISGYLRSALDDSPVIGGTLFAKETGIGTASDENGFYSLTLPKGEHVLLISELNHQEEKAKINLLSDGSHDFRLSSKTNTLDAVVVTSDKYNKVQSTKMGFERLTIASIKEVPLVLGEKDILKVATLLAGVQTVGEGASGFNVRGSPADQNLFYIDKVPVYNTSHLFGFFSAFNSEAISEFSLAKSSIPAKFGGRLASIFDITALEGDKEKYKFRGGISPITGNILFEGPIKKKKSSVMIGLRSTYSNWVLGLIENEDFKNTRANFADGVVKLSFDLNPRNKVQAFGYYSFDKIDFANTTKFDSNNLGSSVSWSHFFNEKSNVNIALVYSKLNLEVENKETLLDAYVQDNALEHKEARADFNLELSDKHKLTTGANAILYDINRGSFNPAGDLSLIKPVELGEERGLEMGLYLSDEWKITDALTLTTGLRYNRYTYLGPQSVLQYQENASKQPDNIIDTLEYGKNEAIKTYHGLDYRVATRYTVNPDFSIKASYNTLHQYIFLLSNTVALAPTDKWKLTDYNIKPMTGHQFSLGFYSNIFRKKMEFSVESYFKKVLQLVEYRDGADILINANPEQDVLQGDLDAYGVEIMLKKPSGRFNGWINYTYSNARALVNDQASGDFINFGSSYPTNYDKPHALNVVGNYKFSRRVSLSANLVYSTGKPITYPSSVYYQNSLQLISYTNRNEYRVPDYFRMDMSLKFEGNLKSKKLLHGSFVFSVYNLTGRKNAYNIYFRSNNGKLQGRKVSIFGVPIFSVSYNFKFGNYDN